jgi:hypothetical protein
MSKEWEVKKEIIARLEKLREKHTRKANELIDKKKYDDASLELNMALGVGEAIHEILYR